VGNVPFPKMHFWKGTKMYFSKSSLEKKESKKITKKIHFLWVFLGIVFIQ
jgi:hypothetical protein